MNNSVPTGPSHVDWQSCKFTKLLEKANHFLETGLYSDCEFLVGDNEGDQEVY